MYSSSSQLANMFSKNNSILCSQLLTDNFYKQRVQIQYMASYIYMLKSLDILHVGQLIYFLTACLKFDQFQCEHRMHIFESLIFQSTVIHNKFIKISENVMGGFLVEILLFIIPLFLASQLAIFLLDICTPLKICMRHFLKTFPMAVCFEQFF